MKKDMIAIDCALLLYFVILLLLFSNGNYISHSFSVYS